MAEFYIVSKLSGYAISAVSAEKGSKLTVKSIDISSPLQKWTLRDGFLQNTNGELVLDIAGASKKLGASLIMYNKHGEDNQQFYWKENAIFTKLNGLCIDIPGESTKEGEYLITYDFMNQLNQLWMIVPIRDATDEYVKNLTDTYKMVRRLNFNDLFVHIEVTNRSKYSFCDPKSFSNEAKFGEIPYWIDKTSTLQKSTPPKRIFVYGNSKKICGLLSFTVFNDGTDDPRVVFYFSQKTSLFNGCSNVFNVEFVKDGTEMNQDLCDQLEMDAYSPDDSIQTFVHGRNKASVKISSGTKCFIEVLFE